MHRTVSLVLVIAGLCTASASAADLHDWNNLSALRAGDRIDVIRMDLKKTTGAFAGVSADAVRVTSRAGEVSIPRADVFRVSSRENSKRLRNILIGLAIGGAAGLVTGALVDSSFSEDDEHIAKAIFTPIGLGAGAGIGAAFPAFATIYRAPARRDTTPSSQRPSGLP